MRVQIVKDIGRYIPVLLNTFVKRGYDYIMDFFGYNLLFKDGTDQIVVLVFMMIVTGLIVRNVRRSRHNKSEMGIAVRRDWIFKVVVGLAIIITALLIFTAEYIQWTDPGASDVNGVHARYFFPFMFPALILFTGMSETKDQLLYLKGSKHHKHSKSLNNPQYSCMRMTQFL